MIIEVQQKGNLQWFFHIKADNGKIVAAGETYQRKGSAFKALRAMGYAGKVVHIFPKSGKNSLEKLIVLGRDTQQKVRETLTEGIALMHP